MKTLYLSLIFLFFKFFFHFYHAPNTKLCQRNQIILLSHKSLTRTLVIIPIFSLNINVYICVDFLEKIIKKNKRNRGWEGLGGRGERWEGEATKGRRRVVKKERTAVLQSWGFILKILKKHLKKIKLNTKTLKKINI